MTSAQPAVCRLSVMVANSVPTQSISTPVSLARAAKWTIISA